MKKIIILSALIALGTLGAQASSDTTGNTIVLENEVPAPTEGDKNETTKEIVPESK